MVMVELHLPDNIKVHFAAGEVQNQYAAAAALGVVYSLFTCYPWVERMVFEKAKSPIMPLKWMKAGDTGKLIPRHIYETSRHCIQDSGLFTLMFGSQKAAEKNEALINRWYDCLVEFTLAHGCPVTCVEVDCQKVLGVEKAWEFRQRLRKDLPNNRIINVFHLEDGQKGLDRLIEYSDYIAISVPELRFNGKSNLVYNLASYIKERKPDIDIHLLGCTHLDTLRQCSFCTSSDSTSWIAGKRFGFLKGRYIRQLKKEAILQYVTEEQWNAIAEYNSPDNTNFLCASIEIVKDEYQRYAGEQDYYSLDWRKQYENKSIQPDNA